jgi:hypothetical protein
MSVAHFSKFQPAALVGDFLTDVLHGLNVRERFYLDPESQPEQKYDPQPYPWENYESVEAWIVEVSYEANEEERWPWDEVHSHHRTRRGAEMEAAWLQQYGVESNRIRIYWGWTSDFDYHIPLMD